MERESFEDEEVADVLNRDFISIKVDREERPDIDSIYMNVCQALTGHGGWPLTIIMTPDKKPFYAGTYFPKKAKYGHAGLIEILTHIADKWRKDRDKILRSTEEIYNAIKRADEEVQYEDEEIDEKIIYMAFDGFKRSFDEVYGGFGSAPKFPTPHNLLFLLRYWRYTGEKEALDMVERTLESMYRGGIYDHIGFGFARYSTDRKWLVPHFEKMLYDNALLSIAYTEGFLATGKEIYGKIARDIFTYILRDMRSENGGFFTAEDADSEGEEGKFYGWTPEEVQEVLGKDDGEFFCSYYDITNAGNFEGKSIPNLTHNENPISVEDNELKERLERCRQKLFGHREKRVHPYKDDKILTSWNGLMIAALAIGARAFNEEKYLHAAEEAMDFILNNLLREDGRLLARFRDGESKYPGYLDDYAFVIWALIELFESTGRIKFLEKAVYLNSEMLRLFWDEKRGGLYLYGNDSEELILRPKEVYDGAIPSGNSAATFNFLKLSRILEDSDMEQCADKQFQAFGNSLKSNPTAHSFLLQAFTLKNKPASKIVLVGKRDDETYKEIYRTINSRFLPFVTKVFINEKMKGGSEVKRKLSGYKPVDNRCTAYICKDFTCLEPINDRNKILEMINSF